MEGASILSIELAQKSVHKDVDFDVCVKDIPRGLSSRGENTNKSKRSAASKVAWLSEPHTVSSHNSKLQ